MQDEARIKVSDSSQIQINICLKNQLKVLHQQINLLLGQVKVMTLQSHIKMRRRPLEHVHDSRYSQ